MKVKSVKVSLSTGGGVKEVEYVNAICPLRCGTGGVLFGAVSVAFFQNLIAPFIAVP